MSDQIDARGPRFGAGITVVVLAVAYLTIHSAVALYLLLLQTFAFALGALVGPKAQPYGILYAKFIKPRMSGPVPLEAPEPPRFAQAVGLAFGLAALVGYLTGHLGIALVAIGFALAAAFLNAAFNFCLGCELYLLAKRLTSPRV